MLLLLSSLSTLHAQFITTWKTTQADESITIPTAGVLGYNYTVNWGDGSITDNHTGDANHTYSVANTYTVTITGDFPRIDFGNPFLRDGSNLKIQTIEQWGNNAWQSMSGAFKRCENLEGRATDVPNLSEVKSMSEMFFEAKSFNQNINDWNVENVESFNMMFRQATSFNQNLNGWNVGNALYMEEMFAGAISFNQDLNDWDVSKVTTMFGMFSGATDFNGDITGWIVSEVTNLDGMFGAATSFNQDIGDWDVSNVTEMGGMFYQATSFNQDLRLWDISNVTSISNMFLGAQLSVENYDALLEEWSNLTLSNGLNFHGGTSFYCNATAARQKLIDDFGWTINDGGRNCTLSTPDVSKADFKMFPNPAKNNIQIRLDGVIQKIAIYNLLGAEVWSKTNIEDKTLDISGLSSGTYLLKMQSDAGTIVRKLVKQ